MCAAEKKKAGPISVVESCVVISQEGKRHGLVVPSLVVSKDQQRKIGEPVRDMTSNVYNRQPTNNKDLLYHPMVKATC